MAELSKRTTAFPGHKSKMLRQNFHTPQRERVVLAADAKPQHGMAQPMPKRDA
jgi:hypothetical protein